MTDLFRYYLPQFYPFYHIRHDEHLLPLNTSPNCPFPIRFPFSSFLLTIKLSLNILYPSGRNYNKTIDEERRYWHPTWTLWKCTVIRLYQKLVIVTWIRGSVGEYHGLSSISAGVTEFELGSIIWSGSPLGSGFLAGCVLPVMRIQNSQKSLSNWS